MWESYDFGLRYLPPQDLVKGVEVCFEFRRYGGRRYPHDLLAQLMFATVVVAIPHLEAPWLETLGTVVEMDV